MKSELPRWVVFVAAGWMYALVGGLLGALRGLHLTANPTSEFLAAFSMAVPAGLVLLGMVVGVVVGAVVGEFIALAITLVVHFHSKENVRRGLDAYLDPVKANRAIEAKAGTEGLTPEVIRRQLLEELDVVESAIDAWLSGNRVVSGYMLTRIAKALDTTREDIVVVEGRGSRSEQETLAPRRPTG